jgi:hypothetical protein
MLRKHYYLLVLISLFGLRIISFGPGSRLQAKQSSQSNSARPLNKVNRVDEFGVGGCDVAVFFFNPSLDLSANHKSYDTLPPKEKREIWSENLHKVAIYLFDVTSHDKQKRYGFVLRGNPAITNSAFFYQLDVVDMTTINLTNPNEEKYEQRIIQNYAMPMVRGSLFEHMFPIDKGKQLAGNGIEFNGYFVRVTPYQEIRNAVSEKISEFLKSH